MIQTRAVFVVMTMIVCAAVLVSADTPANCHPQTFLGKWTFHIGARGQSNTIKCSSVNKQSEMSLTLLPPNLVTDDEGNIGTWTAIYNQGFEVRINNDVYFAFSEYVTQNNQTTSYCNMTKAGWVHNTKNADWGCYLGIQTEASHPVSGHMMLDLEPAMEADPESKFEQDEEMIDRLNSVQKSWVAAKQAIFEGLSKRDVQRMAGGMAAQRIRAVSPGGKPQLTEMDEKFAASLPTTFSWRNVGGKNYVSPIRNQEQCGSCYTFATTAVLEARLRILTNLQRQDIFAPQSIVSCSEYSQGCNGGFAYLVSKYGHDFEITTESCFPYTGRDQNSANPTMCSARCNDSSQFLHVNDWGYVGGYFGATDNDKAEVLMQLELLRGPIAVGIEVDKAFLAYKSGVFTDTNDKAAQDDFYVTNHAVTVTGWGVENGVKYWEVKNSWGTSWGEEGYVRVERGVNCIGIESMPAWMNPVV